MTDYTNLIDKVNIPELVKALRHCISDSYGFVECDGCPIFCKGIDCQNDLHNNAAVAIEALQAEVDKANKSADAYRAMYFTKHGDITIEKVRELDEIDYHFHSALIRLMYKRIEELESEENRQLPKRDEWIRIDKYTVQCPLCHRYLDLRGVNAGRGDANYCPNCGAKMEVQE